MQIDGNEGGMSVEELATLLSDEKSSDPKSVDGETPADETEVEAQDEQDVVPDKSDDDPVKENADASDAESDDDEGDADKSGRPSRSRRLKMQLERARAEIEALRAGTPQQRQDAKPEDVLKAEIERRLGPAPKEADFGGDYLAYERAMTARQTAELIMAPQLHAEAQRAQQARQQQIQERVSDFWDAADGLAKKVPDIRKALESMPSPPESLAELFLDDLEKGPLVAYFLAKNPSRAAELARMSPRAQAVEYGRLSASLSLPKPKAATQAAKPAPVAPVKGGGAKPSRSLADMSMDEFASRLTRDLYRG